MLDAYCAVDWRVSSLLSSNPLPSEDGELSKSIMECISNESFLAGIAK